MKWIRTWAKIEDDKSYLVMAVGPKEWKRLVYRPQILIGWQVKRLIEGAYLATEFFPPRSLEECE